MSLIKSLVDMFCGTSWASMFWGGINLGFGLGILTGMPGFPRWVVVVSFLCAAICFGGAYWRRGGRFVD